MGTTTTTTTWVTTTISEPSTEPPTEAPMPVLYLKSPERMTFSEARTYCSEHGMELALAPHKWKNPLGREHVSQCFFKSKYARSRCFQALPSTLMKAMVFKKHGSTIPFLLLA